MQDEHYILPAEWFGVARVEDGTVDIGGVKAPWNQFDAHVYIRRLSTDLSIMEIHIAHHDGLAQEQLDHQNDEAASDPRGPKAYWLEHGVSEEEWGDDDE